MNLDDFLVEFSKKVGIEEARESLRRFIQKEPRISIPARPDDDDTILSRALGELDKTRNELRKLHEFMEYLKGHIDPGIDPQTFNEFFRRQPK